MSTTSAFALATDNASDALHLTEIQRRAPGPNDVKIHVTHCGMCHSGLHHSRDEWGTAPRPAVVGHEVVGIVESVGSAVSKFKVGDRAGVGCFVDSCRKCPECLSGEIQYCSGKRTLKNGSVVGGLVNTFGSPVDNDAAPHTHGGFSTSIVCNEDYVLRIPANLELARAAPLLCAGITTYSPLKYYGVKKGDHVAVLGLGGLGHMGVKFAKALGAVVTVISRSPGKEKEALGLGATSVLISSDAAQMAKATRTFDFILDTVSAKHDLGTYLNLLKTNGTCIIVGGVPEPLDLHTFSLIIKRIKIGGSLVGGIIQTQEMLDFCSAHNILCDIELVSAAYANHAWKRMLNSDVKFRFVLDVEKTLKAGLVMDA